MLHVLCQKVSFDNTPLKLGNVLTVKAQILILNCSFRKYPYPTPQREFVKSFQVFKQKQISCNDKMQKQDFVQIFQLE